MTTYHWTVPNLIKELRKWARARDRVNTKPNREGRPLSSALLLEAANRLEEYHDQFVTCHDCGNLFAANPESLTLVKDDSERLANYQARRFHCEPDHDHSDQKEATS